MSRTLSRWAYYLDGWVQARQMNMSFAEFMQWRNALVRGERTARRMHLDRKVEEARRTEALRAVPNV